MNRHSLLDLLATFHDRDILVVGDVMLDCFIYGSVARISPEAPVPIVRILRQSNMPGGAANVVRNVATLGARSTLIGVVGMDVQAQQLREQLARFPSVEVRFVADPARPTTTKTRYIADRQHVLRADWEDSAALADSVAEQVLREYRAALKRADLVVLSDYAKGVLTPNLVTALIAAASAAGKAVIVDPKSVSFAKYSGATILTPNRHELELACGHECRSDDRIVSGARRILDQEVCETLIVTRGEEGMSVVTRDGAVDHLRATAREVFDVSGAGDTVVASLALSLAGGSTLAAAATVANLAAGLVVAKPGTATVSTGEIAASLSPYSPDGPSKIFTLEHVQPLAESWRAAGLKLAFTNGCFDLLHPGHISLLQQARASADRLIVGLNSDLSVRRLKGSSRPVHGEIARATILASLKFVDAVVIFSEDNPLQMIEALAPDVLVKGADYALEDVVGADLVMRRGGKVLLAELVAGQSTTGTLARVAAGAVT